MTFASFSHFLHTCQFCAVNIVRLCIQAVDDESKDRTEACRRLCMLETRYADEMADGIIKFVRRLRGAVLSKSDSNTLFQNVEKVYIMLIRPTVLYFYSQCLKSNGTQENAVHSPTFKFRSIAQTSNILKRRGTLATTYFSTCSFSKKN